MARRKRSGARCSARSASKKKNRRGKKAKKIVLTDAPPPQRNSRSWLSSRLLPLIAAGLAVGVATGGSSAADLGKALFSTGHSSMATTSDSSDAPPTGITTRSLDGAATDGKREQASRIVLETELIEDEDAADDLQMDFNLAVQAEDKLEKTVEAESVFCMEEPSDEATDAELQPAIAAGAQAPPRNEQTLMETDGHTSGPLEGASLTTMAAGLEGKASDLIPTVDVEMEAQATPSEALAGYVKATHAGYSESTAGRVDGGPGTKEAPSVALYSALITTVTEDTCSSEEEQTGKQVCPIFPPKAAVATEELDDGDAGASSTPLDNSSHSAAEAVKMSAEPNDVIQAAVTASTVQHQTEPKILLRAAPARRTENVEDALGMPGLPPNPMIQATSHTSVPEENADSGMSTSVEEALASFEDKLEVLPSAVPSSTILANVEGGVDVILRSAVEMKAIASRPAYKSVTRDEGVLTETKAVADNMGCPAIFPGILIAEANAGMTPATPLHEEDTYTALTEDQFADPLEGPPFCAVPRPSVFVVEARETKEPTCGQRPGDDMAVIATRRSEMAVEAQRSSGTSLPDAILTTVEVFEASTPSLHPQGVNERDVAIATNREHEHAEGISLEVPSAPLDGSGQEVSAAIVEVGRSAANVLPDDAGTTMEVLEGERIPLELQPYCSSTLPDLIFGELQTCAASSPARLTEYAQVAASGRRDDAEFEAFPSGASTIYDVVTAMAEMEAAPIPSLLAEGVPAHATTREYAEVLATPPCPKVTSPEERESEVEVCLVVPRYDIPMAMATPAVKEEPALDLPSYCPATFPRVIDGEAAAREVPSSSLPAGGVVIAAPEIESVAVSEESLSCEATFPQVVTGVAAEDEESNLTCLLGESALNEEQTGITRVEPSNRLPGVKTDISCSGGSEGVVHSRDDSTEEGDAHDGNVGFQTPVIAGMDASAAVMAEGGGLTSYPEKSAQEPGGGDSGLDVLVQKFNLWVRSVDFPVRKIEAMVVGNGMRVGAVATEVLDEGQPYLTVPESIILDASKATSDPELGPPLAKLRDSLSSLGLWDDDVDSLRILLVIEAFTRADRSPWVSYLSLLPTPTEVAGYHPLFFDDTTTALLKGSDLMAAVKETRKSEERAFESKFGMGASAARGLEEIFGEGWMTLQRYLWATAILDSRAVWWGGRGHLVPLLDLVNNDQGPLRTRPHETVRDSNGNAVTRAGQSFEKATQVFENYGRQNHVLFLHYGFSLGRGNRHDCVRIDAERPPPGPRKKETLARMQEAFPYGRPLFCVSLDSYGPYDFVSYLRIMAGLPALAKATAIDSEALSSTETSVADETSGPSTVEDVPVGVPVHERWKNLHNESESLKVVVDFLELRLSRYPQALVEEVSDGSVACRDVGRCTVADKGDLGSTGGGKSKGYGAITTEETIRIFLDSEQYLLRQLRDYLAVSPSRSPSLGKERSQNESDPKVEDRPPNVEDRPEARTYQSGTVITTVVDKYN